MKYETELYGVLILIVLFLVLVNFSSIRIATQLQGIFEDQVFSDLLESARRAETYLGDQPALKSSTRDWHRFINDSYADSISLEEIDSNDSLRWRFDGSQISALDSGGVVTAGPDSESNAPSYALMIRFETNDGRCFILRTVKRAERQKLVTDVTRFSVFFQLSGLLAIVLLSYLYLRVTLKPYRKMKKAAQDAHLPDKSLDSSVEQIVATFQAMIEELREKEKRLQELYHKTQKRAARLEQFNEYILAGMASGLISCDREGTITNFNMSAQKLLGIGETKALGCHFSEILIATPKLAELIAETLTDEINASRIELEIAGTDGNRLSLGVSTTLICDEFGRKVGATVIMTDLTEIKRLQKDIAYKDKMAALGETAAGLAHELRNSMTAIVGYGGLMLKIARDNPQLRQAAEAIAREGAATEQMLRRFLEFAQPTSFYNAWVDIQELIKEQISSLSTLADERGVTLRSRLHASSKSVWADQLAVRQVIANLMLNAIEASTNGSEVTIETVDEGTEFVAMRVIDNGPGIPDEIRAKVFTPFFTTKEDGNGLGLCTVKKLVTGMNGRLELSKTTESGFAVTVYLPRCENDRSVGIRAAEAMHRSR
jgi:PAS domain S-box-containing protein